MPGEQVEPSRETGNVPGRPARGRLPSRIDAKGIGTPCREAAGEGGESIRISGPNREPDRDPIPVPGSVAPTGIHTHFRGVGCGSRRNDAANRRVNGVGNRLPSGLNPSTESGFAMIFYLILAAVILVPIIVGLRSARNRTGGAGSGTSDGGHSSGDFDSGDSGGGCDGGGGGDGGGDGGGGGD